MDKLIIKEDEEVCLICEGSGYHGTITDEDGSIEDAQCDSCDGKKKLKKENGKVKNNREGA